MLIGSNFGAIWQYMITCISRVLQFLSCCVFFVFFSDWSIYLYSWLWLVEISILQVVFRGAYIVGLFLNFYLSDLFLKIWLIKVHKNFYQKIFSLMDQKILCMFVGLYSVCYFVVSVGGNILRSRNSLVFIHKFYISKIFIFIQKTFFYLLF